MITLTRKSLPPRLETKNGCGKHVLWPISTTPARRVPEQRSPCFRSGLTGTDWTQTRLICGCDQFCERSKSSYRRERRGSLFWRFRVLEKLMIDEFTLSAALYGDLQMRIRGEPGFPHDLNRKPNGFFIGTTRVSAVVIERMNINPDRVSVNREVFPTNNPQAKVLTLEELKLFGNGRGGPREPCPRNICKAYVHLEAIGEGFSRYYNCHGAVSAAPPPPRRRLRTRTRPPVGVNQILRCKKRQKDAKNGILRPFKGT